MEDRFYTYKDLMNYLGLTRNSVEKRVKRLKLNPQKDNGIIYFTQGEFDLIINYKPQLKYFYRVSVLEDGVWVIKHFGLSYAEAKIIEEEYLAKNIYAMKIRY